MEGRRLIEGLLEGLDSEGLRANKGLDATLVRPLAVLDLTELKTDRIPPMFEDLLARGLREKRGMGRSGSLLGSSVKSTKKPTSPSAALSDTLPPMKPPSLCCVDERLRAEVSREKEGSRSIRGVGTPEGGDLGSLVSI
jgi:hypothetical protein